MFTKILKITIQERNIIVFDMIEDMTTNKKT